MQSIVDFFDGPLFVVVGGVSTLLVIAGFILAVWLGAKGIIAVWYRVGMGLAKRKIAVFATNEFVNLRGILVDSRLFKPSNIIQIDKNSIRKAESATLLLVHWRAFEEHIDEILRVKSDSDALIVYAPQKEGFIDSDSMDKITAARNTIVVNLRGRLLNDIFTTMITSRYE